MIDKQRIKIILGLLAFILLGGGGIFLAWKLSRPETTTAPLPSEAAVGGGELCTLTFLVEPGETPTPTPTPVCEFSCLDLRAYDSDWNEITAPLAGDPPQTVRFVVKGEANEACPGPIDGARFKFIDEDEAEWRDGTELPIVTPMPGDLGGLGCDSDHPCYYWDIELTERRCYDGEATVCIGDNCVGSELCEASVCFEDAPTSTPTPTPTEGPCDFDCYKLVPYTTSWERIDDLENFDGDEINVVVQGWLEMGCAEDALDEGRLRLLPDGSWDSSSVGPPEDIQIELECDNAFRFCFAWEGVSLEGAGECYDFEAEVCLNGVCH